jgi:hypothetical protein
MVPPELTKSDRDQRIRAFLDYAVTDGQQSLPSGYAALPKSLQAQTLQYTGDEFLATTTTTTSTTTPTTLGGNTGGSGGYTGNGSYTGGYSDGSYSGSGDLTGTTTPTATPSGQTGSKGGKATSTTAPKVAKLAGMRLPDSGDRLVLPIVLVLAAVALIVRGAVFARDRIRLRRAR